MTRRVSRRFIPAMLAWAFMLACAATSAADITYWNWQDGTYALCSGHTVIIGIGDGDDHALCDY